MVVITVNASIKFTEVCLILQHRSARSLDYTLVESVTEPEILAILGPMIERYARERLPGEHFGDFTIRAGYIAPTTEGKAWYDRMGGEGIHQQASTDIISV